MKNFCCSRREMLGKLGGGFGSLALMDLLSRRDLLAAETRKNPLAPKPQQIPAKAKATPPKPSRAAMIARTKKTKA